MEDKDKKYICWITGLVTGFVAYEIMKWLSHFYTYSWSVKVIFIIVGILSGMGGAHHVLIDMENKEMINKSLKRELRQ